MSKITENLDSLLPLLWAGVTGVGLGGLVATVMASVHLSSLNDEQPYIEKSRCTAGQVEVLVKEPDDVQRWYATAATCDEEQAE